VPRDIAEWFNDNMSDSRFTVSKPWRSDVHGMSKPLEIVIDFEPVDRMMFDLHFAGRFIYDYTKGCWYDDTELNRWMIDINQEISNV